MNIKQEFKEITALLLDSYKADYETTLTEAIDRLENLEKAITDTRCCDKLKYKEVPTFKEWIKHFKNDGNYYLFGKEKLYSEKEMLNIYNNLPDY